MKRGPLINLGVTQDRTGIDAASSIAASPGPPPIIDTMKRGMRDQ